jgi:hypothetical protein
LRRHAGSFANTALRQRLSRTAVRFEDRLASTGAVVARLRKTGGVSWVWDIAFATFIVT